MTKTQVLLKRFIKGAIAGAISMMLTITIPSVLTYPALIDWGATLLVAGIAGAITGLLITIDKALRWREDG